MAAHATDVVNFYGHNDLGNGRSVASMVSLEKLFCARPEVKNVRKWRATLTPFTQNAKGVPTAQLTEKDQTPHATSPAILEFNRLVRSEAGLWGYHGTLELGGALATGLDSPFWKPGLASDGTHFGRHANPLLIPVARKVLGPTP